MASKGGVIFLRTLMFSVYFPVLAGYVHQYNSLNSQPDVMKSLYSPLQPSSSLEGLRYSIKNFKSQHTKFCSLMGREKMLTTLSCINKYASPDYLFPLGKIFLMI